MDKYKIYLTIDFVEAVLENYPAFEAGLNDGIGEFHDPHKRIQTSIISNTL